MREPSESPQPEATLAQSSQAHTFHDVPSLLWCECASQLRLRGRPPSWTSFGAPDMPSFSYMHVDKSLRTNQLVRAALALVQMQSEDLDLVSPHFLSFR